MLKLQLVPIKQSTDDNKEFADNPICNEIVLMTVAYYKIIGYMEPWIGYLVKEGDGFIGSGGFKGKPINGKIEIAYTTFEQYRSQGYGQAICRLLVELSLATDPAVIITARTLPEHNHSTGILQKNNFILKGVVNDPDDGDVWEWEYIVM